MSPEEQSILDHVNAENYAVLYRCRWSSSDAEVIVPQLVALLSSKHAETVNEALRALFRIGTPAEDAAAEVASLVNSPAPITKQLAVLTLGQIAHRKPELCVEKLSDALTNELCCRDALRILAFIGTPAKRVLNDVTSLYSSRDAKVRKAVVVAAVAIGGGCEEVAELLRTASSDRSKTVRDTAVRALDQTKRA